MIERDDLRAGVAAGLLTERQAAGLARLAADRRDALDRAPSQEEPFELFRGFNEIFIVVGLAILASGWIGVWAVASTTSENFKIFWTIAGFATLGVIALLSEYFVRRRRMIAPAIALTLGWMASALGVTGLTYDSVTVLGGFDLPRAVAPLALSTAALALYWWRYRVPFAMALIALGAFATLLVGLSVASGAAATPRDLFVLSGQGLLAWATLALGLALFALAMRFDMSDPHRMTLRSANGFWLHVVAAPAIVNTLAITLIDLGGPSGMMALAILLLAVAFVAVVIDRRSFLISAAGYVVVLVSRPGGEGEGTALAVLALGAGLVALGAGWQGFRRRALGPVPRALRDRLPPAA